MWAKNGSRNTFWSISSFTPWCGARKLADIHFTSFAARGQNVALERWSFRETHVEARRPKQFSSSSGLGQLFQSVLSFFKYGFGRDGWKPFGISFGFVVLFGGRNWLRVKPDMSGGSHGAVALSPWDQLSWCRVPSYVYHLHYSFYHMVRSMDGWLLLFKRTSCMWLVYVTMWDGHGGLQAASKRSWNSFLGCWLKLVVCETKSVWRLTRAALSLWGWQGLRRGSINPSRIPRLNYSDLFFYHRHRLYFRMARTIIGGRLLYKGGLECGHRWLHTSCPLLDTTKHGWLNPFLETVLEWIYLWAARVGCVRVGLSGAVLTDPCLFGLWQYFEFPSSTHAFTGCVFLLCFVWYRRQWVSTWLSQMNEWYWVSTETTRVWLSLAICIMSTLSSACTGNSTDKALWFVEQEVAGDITRL